MSFLSNILLTADTALSRVTNEVLAICGSGLCHQFAERSFDFGGVMWAVCARCSGIYVGLIFAIVALFLAYRIKKGGGQRSGFMAWPYWLFLAAGLTFMGWDGVTSYAHIRETTNFLRWVTGIGMGASLAPLLYFLLVSNLAKRSVDKPVMGLMESKNIFGRLRPWLAVSASMLVSFLMVYPAGNWLGGVGAVIAALCIWFTFSLLALVLLGLAKPFYLSIGSARDLLVPGTIALVLGVLMILAFAAFNSWQIQMWGQ
jgi:uncharacterized membrane protein